MYTQNKVHSVDGSERHMKHFYLILVLFFITGCNHEDKKSSADQIRNQPLIFLHYWSEEMGGGIEEMVLAFNENNPGYSVKQTGFDHESFKVSMKVMLKAGNPPDIFSYWAGARTESLIKKGYLASIAELWNKESLDTLFSKTVRDACFYDDVAYMLPVTQHYVSFYYNRKLFEKYSIKPPQNWEQFLVVCKTLKENGEVPISLGAQNLWPAQFWFDYLLLRTAGQEYREKLMSGKASYTDSEVKYTFNMWKELLDNGYFSANPLLSNWADAAKKVGDGEAAMTLMGTWLIGYFDHTLKLTQGNEYDYFSFPLVDEGIGTVALGPIDGILLPQSGNEEKAKNVLAIFTSPDVQKAMSSGSGSLSPAKSVVPEASKKIQRRIHQEIQETDFWAFNYDLATPPPVAEKGLALFGAFLAQPNKMDSLLEHMQKECSTVAPSEW